MRAHVLCAKLQIEFYSSDVRAFKRTVRDAAFSQRIFFTLVRMLLTLGLWPLVFLMLDVLTFGKGIMVLYGSIFLCEFGDSRMKSCRIPGTSM